MSCFLPLSLEQPQTPIDAAFTSHPRSVSPRTLIVVPACIPISNRVVSVRVVNLPQCVFVPVFSVTHTSCSTSLQSNQKSCCYQSRRFSFVEHHHIDFVPVFFGPPLLQSIITIPRKVSSPPVVFELTRLVVPVRGPLTGKSFEQVLTLFFVVKRVVSVRGRLTAGSF